MTEVEVIEIRKIGDTTEVRLRLFLKQDFKRHIQIPMDKLCSIFKKEDAQITLLNGTDSCKDLPGILQKESRFLINDVAKMWLNSYWLYRIPKAK